MARETIRDFSGSLIRFDGRTRVLSSNMEFDVTVAKRI